MATKWQKIKVILISQGQGKGPAIFFDPKKPFSIYRGKIVVIDDLDVSEIIPGLKEAVGIIAEAGGITAHGAVLAPGFKLPLVIMPKAKENLFEGQMVSLDGQGFISWRGTKSPTVVSSGRESTKTKIVRRGKWILVKAGGEKITHSRFLDDFVRPGELAIAKAFSAQGKQPKVRFDQSGIWAINYPLPQKMAEKILAQPRWFWRQVKKQEQDYTDFKRYIRRLADRIRRGMDVSQTLRELKSCRAWFTQVRPHIFLFAYPIDLLEKKFYQLSINFLSPALASDLFDQVGRSRYAKKIASKGIARPRVPKSISFPPSSIKIIQFRPDYGRRIRPKRAILLLLAKQPKDFQRKFNAYLNILPTLVEINDEICYVTRTFLSGLVPRLLRLVAQFLVSHGIFTAEKEVFDYTVDELEKKVMTVRSKTRR